MSIKLSSLKPENAKAWVMLVGGLLLVIVIIYYVNKTFGGFSNLFSSLSQKLGLSTSPEQAARAQAAADAAKAAGQAGSPWNPAYFANSPGGASLSDEEGDKIAKDFWDSVSWFSGADYTKMFAALHEVPSKTDLSFVVTRFSNNYGKDLWTWLQLQFFSTIVSDQNSVIENQVNTYVSSLPNSNG